MLRVPTSLEVSLSARLREHQVPNEKFAHADSERNLVLGTHRFCQHFPYHLIYALVVFLTPFASCRNDMPLRSFVRPCAAPLSPVSAPFGSVSVHYQIV